VCCMNSNIKSEVDRWLQQAEYDIESARIVIEHGLYSWACFMCQQSSEKAVNAFLYSNNVEEVWGHSLADLCEDAKDFDPSFEMIKSIAILLDKYYFSTRYPSYLPGGNSINAYSKDEALKAIEISQEVLSFVRGRIHGD